MLHRLFGLTIAGALVACAAEPAPPPADLVIRNAAIVDVENGQVTRGRSIFIEDGVITGILSTENVAVPEGAGQVNAAGRYVIPGLWDMHVHSAANVEWHFPALLANGITGVRNMHTTVDDALELVDSIKTALASGDPVGPRFVANGPIIDGEPPVWPGTVVVRDPESARVAVDSLAEGGADFIKIYDSLTLEEFRAVMEAAHARGIPVDGHMPFAVPPVVGATAGMRTVEHTSGITMGCSTEADAIRRDYADMTSGPPLPFPESEIAYLKLLRRANDSTDPALCRQVANAYREHGVAATPTLINGWARNHAAEIVADEAAIFFLPPAVLEEWTRMAGPGPGDMFKEIMSPVAAAGANKVGILHDAGVTLLAGTDLGNPFLVPGYSLHQELQLLVDAGLTPLEALQAATVNPARVLGISDSIGKVDRGQVADLVLLDANPVEDIGNAGRVAAVVAGGRYLDRSVLERMVVEAVSPGHADAP